MAPRAASSFALGQCRRGHQREGEEQELGRANAIEIDGFARCFSTADQKEGMAAFLAKRPPQFTGR